MRKLPYLRTNRFNIYYLRLPVPTYLVENSGIYRDFQVSMLTRDYKLARKIYIDVLGLYGHIVNMNSEDLDIQSLKLALKDRIKHLIECVEDSPQHWRTDLAERRVKNETETLVDLVEQLHQENRALKQDLREEITTRKALEALSYGSPGSIGKIESKPLGELSELYLIEKKKEWKPRTYVMNSTRLQRFCEIVGFNTLSGDVSGSTIDYYRSIISTLPKNAQLTDSVKNSKDSEKIKQTWQSLTTSDISLHLAAGGQEKHFSTVRPFLTWMTDRFNIEQDFRKYIEISAKRQKQEAKTRLPFNEEQLKLIFNGCIYSDYLGKQESPKTFHFWAPLMALTTGMRVAEIATLEVEDIYKIDEVWVIDINERWRSKALENKGWIKSKKNDSSVRKIPVPQVLIDAGFIDFATSQIKSGLVFHDLTFIPNKGMGNAISKWFNTSYMKRVGVEKQTENGCILSFHSFRHNFVTAQAGATIGGAPIPDAASNYISGHAMTDVKSSTYLHDFDFNLLKKYLDALNFGFSPTNISYNRFLKREKVR